MVAAQNTDLQRVWRLVQELTAQLTENQQETERLRRQVENTTLQTDEAASSEENLKQSQTALTEENTSLRWENEDLSRLCAEYEVGLMRAMDQIRTHEHKVTGTIVEMHRNYQSRMEADQREKDALRMEVVEMQDKLMHLNEFVRDALRNQTHVEVETIVEALTTENEVLRSRVQDLERHVDRSAPGT